MKYNLWLFAGLWWSLFAALLLLPDLSLTRTLTTVGSLLLAGIIADLMVKAVVALAPRSLLPDLSSRAVLVTGCSSGFGLRLVQRLDALGVTVYAGVRNPLCSGAQQLKETCSDNLHIVVLDVTKEEQVHEALEYVTHTIGDKVLWAVVNNAAVVMASPIEWTSDSDFSIMWDTNTMGAVRMTKTFLPLLRTSAGRVVFVNSLAGYTVSPASVPYSMTKFALAAFAEGLRQESCQWGVSVHSIHPYYYRTAMIETERLLRKVDENWRRISAEVRDSYGEDYLKNAKRVVKLVSTKFAFDDIDVPVADIIDAAVGATPQLSYVPGWRPKIYVRLWRHIPASISDWIIKHHHQLQ